MKVKLCFNKKVGIGIQAVNLTPRGTKVLYYYVEGLEHIDHQRKGKVLS